jgi:hypothetical protein
MIVKNLISKAERELVKEIKNEFEKELQGMQEFDEDLNINKRYIELRAMVGLCRKLLG